MFEKNTYKEMLCPVCGEFYFSALDDDGDDSGYFSKLKDLVGIHESVPQCHHCGWKYDLSQIEDEELKAGENDLSLREYREWYSNTISTNPDYNFLGSQYSPEPHNCPVCGKHIFKDIGSYEICPVCGWTDDPVMNDNPDLKIGANDVSLNDYKKRFAAEKE